MSVPQKYRHIGDFHEYYSGQRKAPYLTVFVGGNHEASSYLWELYYGGWVAPNIYYLGSANVIRCGSLRIAGLSGIWKGYNYKRSHYERLPYNRDDEKSIYHVRELDVRKLLQVRTQVDVGISHDWPRGIEWQGNWKALFTQKKAFEADARAGALGSSAARYVMDRLRPTHWFSAHMHCKFTAVVNYSKSMESTILENNGKGQPGLVASEPRNTINADEINIDFDEDTPSNHIVSGASLALQNSDEIDLDMEYEEPANVIERTSVPSQKLGEDYIPDSIRAQLPASFNKPTARPPDAHVGVPSNITNEETQFLALDKCLPNRQFLQLLVIDPISQAQSSETSDFRLSYDKEWLAITRVFAGDLKLGDVNSQVPPNMGESHYLPLIIAEETWVDDNIVGPGLMKIPENFEITAPVYDPAIGVKAAEQPKEYTNPQTTAFCKLLGIENKFHASEEEREERFTIGLNKGSMHVRHGGDIRGGRRGRNRSGRGGGRGRASGRTRDRV